MTDLEKKPFDKAEHQDYVRSRFDELSAQVDAIQSVSGPMRDKRDEIVRAHRAEEDGLNAEIGKVENGLFALMQERAMYARQLTSTRSIKADTMTSGVVADPAKPDAAA